MASGTATLKRLCSAFPEIGLLQTSRISDRIGLKAPHQHSLYLTGQPDHNKPVVVELIQHKSNGNKLQQELELLLHNEKNAARQLQQDYAELWQRLGEGSNASAKAAGLILDFLTK